LLTWGGSKTVVPRIWGADEAAVLAGAGAAAVLVAAEVSACGAGWLLATGASSFRGALHAATIKSAPITTAVRRIGNKCLLDIEISGQISETA
jgi:hypothetical protein